MISLSTFTGSCNILCPKTCVRKKTKDINVEAFSMIIEEDEAKTMKKHISRGCKYKFNSSICNSKQKWINKTCQWDYKNCQKCKKDFSWSPSAGICENSKYLKSIGYNLGTECAAVVITRNNLSTKKITSIAAKKTNASINYHQKKVRYCYILHTILLVFILVILIIF